MSRPQLIPRFLALFGCTLRRIFWETVRTVVTVLFGTAIAFAIVLALTGKYGPLILFVTGVVIAAFVIRMIVKSVNRRDDPQYASRPPGDLDASLGNWNASRDRNGDAVARRAAEPQPEAQTTIHESHAFDH